MADRRIRVPKDKADIVKKLKFDVDDNPNGLFKQYSDLMVFAAMVGYNNNKFVPFDGSLIDPIRENVFISSGTDKIFYLLSLINEGKPENLAKTDEAENTRAIIFESYANGGLELLQQQLHGKTDPLDHLLLVVNQEREKILNMTQKD